MELMEQKLEEQGTSGLNIICMEGYVDLLEYVLPFYLNRKDDKLDLSISVDFNRSILAPT